MIEMEEPRESTSSDIWELNLLDLSLKSSQPNLDHICQLAEWNAELMGRENLHDPLILLLKKFFTGDWRKKIDDQDESGELVAEIDAALERVPLQDVLTIIKEIGAERADLEEKIIELKDEIDRLTSATTLNHNQSYKSHVNQLIVELQQSVKRMEHSAQRVELTTDDKIDIAQELADFVYMLAKLKNANPEKFPQQQQIDELLEACGGFSFAEAVEFCFYKIGSRLARDRVEFGTGKDKAREKLIFSELIERLEQNGENFDLSKIDIKLVQRKMRELLFQIIGAPERMVVTCDLIIHGKYNGKDVRLLIPRKQNFIYEDDEVGEAIAYSNFMTTGAVGDHEALTTLLQQLPPGLIQEESDDIVNGYKIEKNGKVVRIQGIDNSNQAQAIDTFTTLELGIQESNIISFNTDIIREAFIGLGEDEEAVTKLLSLTNIYNGRFWAGYAELIRQLIIDEDSPKWIQTVPAINTFRSGRTGINTHALLFRGELKVREETIEKLIESGMAEYMDRNTESVAAPILVIEADRKDSLLADLSTRVDESEELTLKHSVVVGKTRFDKKGPKVAISTNSLL